MRAEFKRKEPEVKAKECVIEKIIQLSMSQYIAFTQNLLKDYDFIENNRELMGEKDGVWYCILVTGEGIDEGVLVQSEGASYARYASFVPSILAWLEQENCLSLDEGQATEDMNQQMM